MPLCENANHFIDYFNRRDVKDALKIPQYVQWQRCKWGFFSLKILFNNFFSANLHIGTQYYRNTEMAMQKTVRRVAGSGVKVLIYAGDSGWFFLVV